MIEKVAQAIYDRGAGNQGRAVLYGDANYPWAKISQDDKGEYRSYARAAIGAMKRPGPSAAIDKSWNDKWMVVPNGGHGEPRFSDDELWNAAIDIALR